MHLVVVPMLVVQLAFDFAGYACSSVKATVCTYDVL